MPLVALERDRAHRLRAALAAAHALGPHRARLAVVGEDDELVAPDGGDDGGDGDQKQAPLVGELRKLLRERTRELEVKSVAMERLGERRV